MSGNRSLDEFADEDEDDGAAGRRDGEGAAETSAVEPATGEPTTGEPTTGEPTTEAHAAGGEPDEDRRAAPDTPASTYAWRPGGATCADCGATVEERWRDGDDLVCAGCKEW